MVLLDVEVEFEVDEGTDAETMMKWLLDQVKTFEDNYEGHNWEIVPVVGGGLKFNYITMYWRFSGRWVLAVAMTQRLVEVRDDDQLNTNDMDFIVGCRYEEDADDLNDGLFAQSARCRPPKNASSTGRKPRARNRCGKCYLEWKRKQREGTQS